MGIEPITFTLNVSLLLPSYMVLRVGLEPTLTRLLARIARIALAPPPDYRRHSNVLLLHHTRKSGAQPFELPEYILKRLLLVLRYPQVLIVLFQPLMPRLFKERMQSLVGREGLEPSMFLMSRVYSPLVSPLSTPTHICQQFAQKRHFNEDYLLQLAYTLQVKEKWQGRWDSNPHGRSDQRIFLLLYVTIAGLLRCSLDYVFTMKFLFQVVGIQSLHIYLMLCIRIQLGVISERLSPTQPTFTQKVSYSGAQIDKSAASTYSATPPYGAGTSESNQDLLGQSQPY